MQEFRAGTIFGLSALVKRALDIAGSGFCMIVMLPIFVIVMILVGWSMGSPVFFRQRRPGAKGKPFTLYKFRTMNNAVDGHGELLADGKRLTRFGRWLRSTSLDELPQLWNVLRGDLSLVGPRPLLMQYLERYSPEQARRHEVKPGITGWAQVNGRNAITWEEKFGLDIWYVEHQSIKLDLRILLLTVWQALKRSGISSDGYDTMPEFMESPAISAPDHKGDTP